MHSASPSRRAQVGLAALLLTAGVALLAPGAPGVGSATPAAAATLRPVSRVLACGLYGDVNEDGRVNSQDALIVLSSTVGMSVPNPARLQEAGDVTGDGRINSLDALAVLQFSVGYDVSSTRVNRNVCPTSPPPAPPPPAPAPPPPAPPPPPVGAANVQVDASQTHQTINGWEATLGLGVTYSPSLRDRIVDAAVNDLGVTRLRLEATGNDIEPSNNNYTWGGWVADGSFRNGGWDVYVEDWVVPIKRAVEARGERFVLNVCYVGFKSGSRFQQTSPSEYAEFVSAVLNRLRNRWGLEPDVWELALEPEGSPNEVRPSGQQLGAMLAAAGARARAEGFNRVQFAAPSVSYADNFTDYLDDILAVPGARNYLAELVYHRYGDTSRATLNAIRDRGRQLGVRTAQLEKIEETHQGLYDDLTQANVSAWQQFTLAYQGDSGACGGALYVIGGANFSIADCAKHLRQYFRYVRPGAVRLGASSSDGSIHPVAFRNSDGKVVVVANTDGAATLRVAGLPAGTYRVTHVTGWGGAVGNGGSVTVAAGGVLAATIPGHGVITIAP